MRPATILVASVGRQRYLVEAFAAACGPGDRVLACDLDPLAAGGAVAARFLRAPRFDGPDYGPWLLELCRAEGVTLLLTLNADELVRLEALRPALADAGTTLLGMPTPRLATCLDKGRLGELSEGTGLRVPSAWPGDAWRDAPADAYPLLAKPRGGRGSRGLTVLETPAAAAALAADRGDALADLLLQRRLDGTEYGLDLVNDLQGRPAAVLVRRKLRMRGGETDVAETVRDDALEAAGRRLAARLGHQGLVDVDVMRAGGVDHLIDVNPRFGGGYVFSHAAGANVPAAIVAWARGREPEAAWLAAEPGVVHARVSSLQRLRADEPPAPA